MRVKSAIFTLAFLAISLILRADNPAQKKVLIVPIDGEINYTQSAFVKRAIRIAEKEKPDLIIFEIDTPGGEAMTTLAISTDISKIEIPTVAFIRPQGGYEQLNTAFSAGAIISMSAKRIYMYPASAIGATAVVASAPGGGAVELPSSIEEKYASAFRTKFASVAESNGYPKNLAIAMVDRDWEVYEVTVDGKKDYLTMDEIEKERNKGKKVEIIYRVIEKGKLLTLTAEDAVRFGVAKAVIKDRGEIYKDYGIENPQEISLQYSWSEELVDFVTSPIVSTILLVGGILGIWVTIKLGAFGIPTVLGILCFSVLFFGGYLAGLAEVPEILLFVAGIILLMAEIFVIPGTGIPALLGIILVFVGLTLALLPGGIALPDIKSNPWEVEGIMTVLLQVLAGFLGAGIGFLLIVKFLPNVPLFSRLVLATELSSGKGFTMPAADNIVGREGFAYTFLRPSGKMEIDGKLYDVVSEGDFIQKGEKIRVAEIEGTRIVVRRVS